jgi:hypothetical protein
MAADTAFTTKERIKENPRFSTSYGAMKLLRIKKLSAGISFHGLGMLGEIPTYVWLADFIERNSGSSMNEFGTALAGKLTAIDSPIKDELAFHLAGYETTDKGKFPAVYRIRSFSKDGKFDCQYLEHPHDYKNGATKKFQGGEIAIYPTAFEGFERYLNAIAIPGKSVFRIPYPNNLAMRTEYLRFQIVISSGVYLLSNQIQWIGGPVTTLSISETGIEDYETRSEIIRQAPPNEREPRIPSTA